MKMLFRYIKPHTGIMSLGLFIKFLASMAELVIPAILAKIVDDIVPTKDITKIFIWGAVMLVCSAAALVCNIVANRMAARSSGKITKKLRHDLFEKISYISARQTDRFTIPSLISRLTSDTYNVNQLLARTQRMGVRAPILLIGGITITLLLDPVLTLVLVAMLPFVVVVVYFVTKKSVPVYANAQNYLDNMVRTVQENITGVRVIKALSKTEYEKKRFEQVNEELSSEERKAGNITSITNPSSTLILNLGLTFVVIVGAIRVNAGTGTAGVIIAFLSYFTIILNALLGITRIFMLYSKGVASANRIRQVIDANYEMPIEAPDSIQTDAHIQFEDVSFSYEGVEDNLSHISFSLKKGETLGIIGATGSGKSTIINLLLRFYDADSGCIRINGENIKSIPTDVLRKKFGIAFQNYFLMADTIRENVDYGRGLSDEEIRKALKASQAYEFVSQLPDGLDHMLTIKGSNLSGGQRQRLIIARALAAHPEILILDDSSSALDYKTDARLRKALHKQYADTTSLIVAQRISSIKNAEHILVLQEGKTIGYGTHSELIENCPVYRHISETQMGGEQYEED